MGTIEIRSVTKLFGPSPRQALAHLRDDVSKETFLERTGHTIGLHGVDLTIERGKIFVVMGLSGSGKSTLIRHINRLIEPTAGSILIDGVDVMDLSTRDLRTFRRERLAMVFQKFGLLPHRSVLANVAFGLRIQGMARKLREERARHWIDVVGLSAYADAYPDELSGGMQQRVGLARALACDTDVLLMDEAFSALDPLIRAEMQEQLMRLQQDLHKTIVFITHDLDEALRLGDRVAILRDGKVVQIGAPQDIVLDPADDYVRDFVKGVNRAKVLTAGAVMAPPPRIVPESATPDEARHCIEAGEEDFVFVVDDDWHLRGMVTAIALDRLQRRGIRSLRGAVRAVAAVEHTQPFEGCLDSVARADHPVPVVDAEGSVVGVLSAKAMMRGWAGLAASQPAMPVPLYRSEPVRTARRASSAAD